MLYFETKVNSVEHCAQACSTNYGGRLATSRSGADTTHSWHRSTCRAQERAQLITRCTHSTFSECGLSPSKHAISNLPCAFRSLCQAWKQRWKSINISPCILPVLSSHWSACPQLAQNKSPSKTFFIWHHTWQGFIRCTVLHYGTQLKATVNGSFVTTTYSALSRRMQKASKIHSVAASTLNKQNRTTDKRWSCSFGTGKGITMSHQRRKERAVNY
jgi:hypothetical protein